MTIVYFAGLGSMGLGMALSCLRAGHQVYGYDPAPEQVASLVAAGGHALDPTSPMAQIAVSVVLNADQTRAALFGPEGLAARLAPGAF